MLRGSNAVINLRLEIATWSVRVVRYQTSRLATLSIHVSVLDACEPRCGDARKELGKFHSHTAPMHPRPWIPTHQLSAAIVSFLTGNLPFDTQKCMMKSETEAEIKGERVEKMFLKGPKTRKGSCYTR